MAQQGEIRNFSWEGRSHGQLQEIVQRGIAGGDEFIAAVREMERRSREQLRADEFEEAETARIKQKRRLTTLAVAFGILFATLLIGLLLSAA